MNNVIIKLVFFTSIVSILNTSGILFASQNSVAISAIIVNQNNNYEYHYRAGNKLPNNISLFELNKTLRVDYNNQPLCVTKFNSIYTANITTNQITDKTSQLDVEAWRSTSSIVELLHNKELPIFRKPDYTSKLNINQQQQLLLTSLENSSTPATLLIETTQKDLLVVKINTSKNTLAENLFKLQSNDKDTPWLSYGVPIIGILAILLAACFLIKN